MDMSKCPKTIPYTYLVIFLPTNQWYYGVRYAKGCNPSDLFKKYFTSSKVIKKLIEEHGTTAFKFEVRKTFDSKEAAIDWEKTVLHRMDIMHRDDSINANVGGAIKITEAWRKTRQAYMKDPKHNPTFGKGHTPEARAKMSVAHTGKKMSKQRRDLMSRQRKGKSNYWLKGKPLTAEHRSKLSASGKGKPKSETTKQRMRESSKARFERDKLAGKTHLHASTKWMTDHIKSIRVNKSDVNSYLSQGWVFGRTLPPRKS